MWPSPPRPDHLGNTGHQLGITRISSACRAERVNLPGRRADTCYVNAPHLPASYGRLTGLGRFVIAGVMIGGMIGALAGGIAAFSPEHGPAFRAFAVFTGGCIGIALGAFVAVLEGTLWRRRHRYVVHHPTATLSVTPVVIAVLVAVGMADRLGIPTGRAALLVAVTLGTSLVGASFGVRWATLPPARVVSRQPAR
jgi:hypothetical protein